MRALLLGLSLALLPACIDELDSDCDQYVDYLCACGVDDCATLGQQFEGAGLAVQEQCRIDLACFEQADSENGEACSIVDTPEESQCLEE